MFLGVYTPSVDDNGETEIYLVTGTTAGSTQTNEIAYLI